MNQITLIGRVGQNPTLTTFTDTDNKLAKFSLAGLTTLQSRTIRSQCGLMSSLGTG